MVAIRLSATVGTDRKLVIQLPDDIPAGKVEIEIRAAAPEAPVAAESAPTAPRIPYEIPYNPAREAARAKLRAAGILSESTRAPEGTVPLTVEERMHLGTLPPGSKSSLEMINEDRGEL
jgi:hypothetical protein